MVNMHKKLRLTHCVTPYLITAGAQARKGNMLNLNVKICCNKDQKVINTVINNAN